MPAAAELAFQPDQLGLLLARHPQIGLREDGDNVARLQQQIG